jgi:hypothetical protein
MKTFAMTTTSGSCPGASSVRASAFAFLFVMKFALIRDEICHDDYKRLMPGRIIGAGVCLCLFVCDKVCA